MRTVLIPIFDGVQSLDITGPLEVFDGATRVAGAGAYRIGTASIKAQTVRTSAGLRIEPDAALDATDEPDILLVPGGPGAGTPDPELIGWLRTHGPRTRRLVSVCTGAFLLAEAGLLAGRRATTHWACTGELAERFPDVRVEPEPIFVRDGDVATSAGVTAGIDLALALVEEDHGREPALTIARWLVMFLRRPGGQAQFSTQLRAQAAWTEPIRRVQHWILAHPEAELTVDALAARANLSPRQFARAFTEQVGTPPGRFVDEVRIESARRGLEDGATGVEAVAKSCGYGTPEAMRRAFLRTLGMAPLEYRKHFAG